jgi:hypothetical protein
VAARAGACRHAEVLVVRDCRILPKCWYYYHQRDED